MIIVLGDLLGHGMAALGAEFYGHVVIYLSQSYKLKFTKTKPLPASFIQVYYHKAL